jgi:hypothetical protein
MPPPSNRGVAVACRSIETSTKGEKSICLIDVLLKIQSSMIVRRLDTYLTYVGLQEQNGFSTARYTDRTAALKIALKNLQRVNQELFDLFRTLSKRSTQSAVPCCGKSSRNMESQIHSIQSIASSAAT